MIYKRFAQQFFLQKKKGRESVFLLPPRLGQEEKRTNEGERNQSVIGFFSLSDRVKHFLGLIQPPVKGL